MKRTALLGLDLVVLVSSYTHSEKPQPALTPQVTNLTLTSTSGFNLTYDDFICSFDLLGVAAIPSDATGSPAPIYSLTTSPAGMTTNATAGRIEWTPSATGSVSVTVEASNSAGSDTQDFNILVGEAPVVDNVVFTSTVGFFSKTDDLFCEYDLGGSAVTAATSWYVSGSPPIPLMALHMPFEGGAVKALNDYSGTGITATPHDDPTWSATAVRDGDGAFVFDGNDDLGAGENSPTNTSYTKTAWVYRAGSGANGGNNVVSSDENTGEHAFWAPDMFGNHLSAGHNFT